MQLIEIEGFTTDQNKRLAKLVKYSVSYSKLWSADTGRSALTGAFNGTLVGIFPKLSITIKKQSESDRKLILQAFNSPFKQISYWDSEKGQKVTKTFYFGDAVDTIRKAVGDNPSNITHEAIDIEAVATTRRE